MASFVPRAAFSIPTSIPKTYYLGHHHAGAESIKGILSSVSLILDCRDMRLPLSTHNPKFEGLFTGRERLVVFTKSALAGGSPSAVNTLRKLYGERALFWDKDDARSTNSLLRRLKQTAEAIDSLTGLRVMVVGMPNVGKSSLLNRLRSAASVEKKSKAAKTGDQPGVTRKVASSVRIFESAEKGGVSGGVFVLDTPGIFQPYVEDGETMIKVALAQGIKKGLISDEILVDYLLYRWNKWDTALYKNYCEPTNDVNVFLAAVARREGKLKAEGVPNLQEAAARVLSEWRRGKLGKFVLDDLSDDVIQAHQKRLTSPQLSYSHAKKRQKEERKREKMGE